MFMLPWDSFLRLVVAFILGGVVGVEREAHHKPAGLRTHALISTAAALFTILSSSPAFGNGNVDPTRIASQILAGMGFVGAGVIISTGGQVKGVTTASSLWLMAAIGMASGLGEFALAGFATLLTLVALVVLWIFEDHRG